MLLIGVMLFFAVIIASSPPYYISDVRYPVPYCHFNHNGRNYTLLNRLGDVTIKNNDIMASKLEITIGWLSDTIYPSCYMCQIGEAYCTSAFAATDSQSTDLSLTNGVTYNFMVVLTREHDPFPLNITSSAYQFKTNTSIILDIKDQLSNVGCDETLNIIIVPIITLRVPFKRDIFSVVYQYSGDDNSTYRQYHECLNASSKIYARFDCSLIRKYYYIKYAIGSNCIVKQPQSPPPPHQNIPLPPSLSPLTWFHLIVETLYNEGSHSNKNTTQQTAIMNQMGLSNVCGKIWYNVLMTSGIEQMKCNEIATLYFDLKPFVQLSIHTVVAKLNIIIKQGILLTNETSILHDLIIANDLLTRNCEKRNDEVFRNETIYDSLIERLEVFNREHHENTMMICASLLSLKLRNDKKKSNNTGEATLPLPYPIYLYQYPTWYFQAFYWLILYYTGHMHLDAILMTSFATICIVMCLFFSCLSFRSIIRRFFCIKRVK